MRKLGAILMRYIALVTDRGMTVRRMSQKAKHSLWDLEPNRHLPGSWWLVVLSESPNPLSWTVQEASGLMSNGALEDLCVAQGWMWPFHLYEDTASLRVTPKTCCVILSQSRRAGWTLSQLLWCKNIYCSARKVISGCCLNALQREVVAGDWMLLSPCELRLEGEQSESLKKSSCFLSERSWMTQLLASSRVHQEPGKPFPEFTAIVKEGSLNIWLSLHL